MFLFTPQGQIQNVFFSGLLKTVTVWPPQAFLNRLTGYLIASAAFPTAIGKGAMSGMQNIGDTGSGLFDSVSNSYKYIYNTAGTAAGFVTSGIHLQSKFVKNPSISVKHFVESTQGRMYVGWSTANPLPVSDTPLANTDQGVIVGFRSTDSNYTVFNNDASGSAVATDLGIPKDTSIHTISIVVSNGNATCSVDNTSTILTTRLPSANTVLNLFIQTESV